MKLYIVLAFMSCMCIVGFKYLIISSRAAERKNKELERPDYIQVKTREE